MQHAALLAFDAAFPVQTPLRARAASLPTISMLGFDMIDASIADTVDAVLAPGRRRVHFINAHCANVAARDPAYKAALKTGDMLLPDGIGVELAARMTGQRFIANLNGTDLTPLLLAEAAERGLSVFLFGGTPGTADKAADTLRDHVPGLTIAGTRDGYGGAEDPFAAISEINASGADILLVAMGVPRQDLWLAQYADFLAPRVTMGVGALLDFLAGNVSRAPAIVRKARSEWVWRLAIEPRRMAQRYLIGNFVFMAAAARQTVQQADKVAIAKRLLDLSVAGGALLALAPLFLLVAAAIKLESRGPVLFFQSRVGRDGKLFQIVKFRSMFTDAEARLAQIQETSDREGVCFKAREDPRVTRVGELIRRFSIDELPQISNVLRGEMSIVGPRPALPREVAAFDARALRRLEVKPGLTGLWQVSGRADVGFDKMIDMDLAYADSRSVLLDLVVIALTFRAVASGRGAY